MTPLSRIPYLEVDGITIFAKGTCNGKSGRMTRGVILAVYKRLLRAAASLEHERAAHFVQVQTCLHFRLQRHVTDAARAERLLEEAVLSLRFVQLAGERGPERNVLKNVVETEWERLQLGRLQSKFSGKSRDRANAQQIDGAYRRWISALALFNGEVGVVTTPVEVASVLRYDDFAAEAPP